MMILIFYMNSVFPYNLPQAGEQIVVAQLTMHISVIVRGRSISNTGQESGFSPEEGEAIYSLSNSQPSVFTILLLLLLLHQYFVLVIVLVRQAGIVHIMIIEHLSSSVMIRPPHIKYVAAEESEPQNLPMQDKFHTRVFTDNCL